ncbi:Flp family type IVb pilin [Desulfoferula mesophila]|uniref:Flp family type IVb pilin n=1 Tax=Desulfoferula mesophila TaxID=3058419 RepID=A0AAU9E981_9BACT|nr:hypothetical protein FAK_07320 [Desulfoferula mesophilus]
MKVWKSLKSLVKDESGISSVEYALLLAFIGALIAAAAALLGSAVATRMNTAASQVGGTS